MELALGDCNISVIIPCLVRRRAQHRCRKTKVEYARQPLTDYAE